MMRRIEEILNGSKIFFVIACIFVIILVIFSSVSEDSYALDTSSGDASANECLKMTDSLRNSIESGSKLITYECFGAKGNGKTDDLAAIKKAHDFANSEYVNKGVFLTVYGTKGKTYYISGASFTGDPVIRIATSTDWRGANFIFDDYADLNKDGKNDFYDKKTGNNSYIGRPIFQIVSPNYIKGKSVIKITDKNNSIYKKISGLKATNDTTSNQLQGIKSIVLNDSSTSSIKQYLSTSSKWAFEVISSDKVYVRTGSHFNDGNKKSELIVFDTKTETIEGGVVWNSSNIEKVNVFPIPEKKVTLKNGNITTLTNNQVYLSDGTRASYTNRNIGIYYTGNVEISGINHYLDETKYKGIVVTKYQKEIEGNLYHGFITPSRSAYVKISNCKFQPHQIVSKYKSDGDVRFGTYDIIVNNSNFVTYDGVSYSCKAGTNDSTCYDNYILNKNKKRWGIMASGDDSKNIVVTNSILNRVDAHTGIYNLYVADSTLGYYGLSVVGNGALFVKRVNFDRSTSIIKLRDDYGSTWNGDVILSHLTYVTRSDQSTSAIMKFNNLGVKNYGYLSYFPQFYVDNIEIDSSNSTYKKNYVNLIQEFSNTARGKPSNSNVAYYFKGNMYVNNIKYSKGSGTISVFNSSFGSNKNKSNLNLQNYGGKNKVNIYVANSKMTGIYATEGSKNLSSSSVNTKFNISINDANRKETIKNTIQSKIDASNNLFTLLIRQSKFTATKSSSDLAPSLTNIKINNGNVPLSFSSSTSSYTVTVSSDVSSVNLSASKSSNAVNLFLDGSSFGSSKNVQLDYGTNKFTFVVTGTYGTKKTYSIVINRQYSFSLKNSKYKYSQDGDYLYTSFDTTQTVILNKLNDNSNMSIRDNYLTKKNKAGQQVGKIKVVNLKTKYSISGGSFSIGGATSYKDFIKNITVNGVTVKVLDGSGNVISDENDILQNSYTINIYYGNTLLDSFGVSTDYVVVDLDKDDDNNIISVDTPTTPPTLVEHVQVSEGSTVSVSDNSGTPISDKVGTGNILSIGMISRIVNYRLAVIGDINGDGLVDRNDLFVFRNDRHSLVNEKFYAADVTKDGQLAINDIDKLEHMIASGS